MENESLSPLKGRLAAGPAFVPDERDLLARIARARKPRPLGGLAAAFAGAAAAMLILLALPGSGPEMVGADLEEEVIEAFGAALTGEESLGWMDMAMGEEGEPLT